MSDPLVGQPAWPSYYTVESSTGNWTHARRDAFFTRQPAGSVTLNRPVAGLWWAALVVLPSDTLEGVFVWRLLRTSNSTYTYSSPGESYSFTFPALAGSTGNYYDGTLTLTLYDHDLRVLLTMPIESATTSETLNINQAILQPIRQ